MRVHGHAIYEWDETHKFGMCYTCGPTRTYSRESRGVRPVCTAYVAEKGKRTYDPERTRNNKLRLQYKMSPSDWDSLLSRQGGGCAICGASDRVLAVDHDHSCCIDNKKTCGKCVRGLLCSNCNTAIGLLGDDPSRLNAALQYLSRALSSTYHDE